MGWSAWSLRFNFVISWRTGDIQRDVHGRRSDLECRFDGLYWVDQESYSFPHGAPQTPSAAARPLSTEPARIASHPELRGDHTPPQAHDLGRTCQQTSLAELHPISWTETYHPAWGIPGTTPSVLIRLPLLGPPSREAEVSRLRKRPAPGRWWWVKRMKSDARVWRPEGRVVCSIRPGGRADQHPKHPI